MCQNVSIQDAFAGYDDVIDKLINFVVGEDAKSPQLAWSKALQKQQVLLKLQSTFSISWAH